ncbi:MAG: succinate dehydrogenase [Sphingomonas bacterium]|jgi:succinate dehydrogenase / fumarate reductase cytochrome b subunit|nr:succinate dehydrogenase [Sphingomonas bacterium]MDB5717006.1 succinate dehydrogenase [Sphingomonas bacterium]
MSRNRGRPLSPHLTIWKWGPHMLVSILHRATGTALALAGTILFVWWLTAAASGPDAYARFVDFVTYDAPPPPLGMPRDPAAPAHLGLTWVWTLVLLGLTWAFFQHMFSGIRHLVLDTGAGYELRTNKRWAMATMFGSAAATVLVWLYILTRV